MDLTYTAFQGERLLATGDGATVAEAAHAAHLAGASHVLIFDDETGDQAELDFRCDPPVIAGRMSAPVPKAGRGRPRLGVVAREVTLLPSQNGYGCQEQRRNDYPIRVMRR